MHHVSPPHCHPLPDEWTRPLDSVARAIDGVRPYRHFALGDFMIMGKEVRRPRPDVVLYKHRYTRRYLNLDQAGHAYRYIGPKNVESTYSGRYVAHRDLRRALDRLELWLLPWMKPGLEPYQFGLPFDERWAIHPDEVGDERDEYIATRARIHLEQMRVWEEANVGWLRAQPLDLGDDGEPGVRLGGEW